MTDHCEWRERALFTAAGDPHSALAALAVQPYQDALTRNTQFANSRMTVKIGAVLSSEHRNFLQDVVYPHLNLIFQSNVASSHGLAFSRRMIEQELVLRKCVITERICDVGGNWAVNLRMGRVNLHSCCPLLDARDAQRQTTREYETRRWLDKVYKDSSHQRAFGISEKLAQKRLNAEKFRYHPDEIYCNSRAELCGKTARTVLFNDSLYDMSLSTVADILDTKEARIAYGNITFSSEMLYSKNGYIKGMDCHWRRFDDSELPMNSPFRKSSPPQERIEFFFENCSNMSYIHNFNDIVLLATQQSITTRTGACYLIERTCKFGMMSMVFTRVYNSQLPSCLSFRMWREEVKGKVLVRLYDYQGVSNANREDQITYEEVLIEESLYEGVLSYALRLDGEKFTEENIFAYTCSKNARMVLNGVDLTVSKSEDVARAYKLAFSIWFIAFMMKYHMSMIHGAFCTREMRNRSIRAAGWSKITASLLIHTLSRSLYDKTMCDGENLVEKFIGKAKDYISKINEEGHNIPRPAASLPEPSISVTEYIDALEKDYEPYQPPYAEYDRYDNCFTNSESAEQIRITMDDLADELRRTNLSDERRSVLTEMYRTCVKRLAQKDKDNFKNLLEPWNSRERLHRVLDEVSKENPIPYTNNNETCSSVDAGKLYNFRDRNVDESLEGEEGFVRSQECVLPITPSHSIGKPDSRRVIDENCSLRESICKPQSLELNDQSIFLRGVKNNSFEGQGCLSVEPLCSVEEHLVCGEEVSTDNTKPFIGLDEKAGKPRFSRTSHIDEDGNSDSTLNPDDSRSNFRNVSLCNLSIECGDEYAAFRFLDKFRGGFSLPNVSGAGGLCGVRALTKAFHNTGLPLSEKQVYEQLHASSLNGACSWFALVDLATVAQNNRRNLMLLVNKHSSLNEQSRLQLVSTVFDKEWDSVFIYHCDNHWQYLSTHAKYSPNIKLVNVMENIQEEETEVEKPFEVSDDEDFDVLADLGIELSDVARAPPPKEDNHPREIEGGGKIIKYVRDRLTKKEPLGDEERLWQNDQIDEETPLIRTAASPGKRKRLKIRNAGAMLSGHTLKARKKKDKLGKPRKRSGFVGFDQDPYSKQGVKIFETLTNLLISFFVSICLTIGPYIFRYSYSIVAFISFYATAVLMHSTVVAMLIKIVLGSLILIFVKSNVIATLCEVSGNVIEKMGTPYELVSVVIIVVAIHIFCEIKRNLSQVQRVQPAYLKDSVPNQVNNLVVRLQTANKKKVNSVSDKPLYRGYKEFKEYSSTENLAELKELRKLVKCEEQEFNCEVEKNAHTTKLTNLKNPPSNYVQNLEKNKESLVESESEAQVNKPTYANLSSVDRERVATDRETLVKSYLDYLERSTENFAAHCEFVWTQRNKFGEKFFQAQFKREKNVANAHVLTTATAGIFDLPKVYTQQEDKSLSVVFVPGENTRGSLKSAAFKDNKLYVESNPLRIMIFIGMCDYLDHMTLRAVMNLESIRKIDATRKFKLIDGVPGCAKSTEIVKTVRKEDMIAVASRAANFELQEKLINARKNPNMSRTIGSRIIGRKETCERLYVDEGLKVHPGELIILAEVCCCKEMVIFGDSKQNRFKPRVPGYIMPENPMHWSVELRTESKTMPRDAVVAVGRLKVDGTGPECDGVGYYTEGITTISPIENSMHIMEITSQGDIPKVANAKYLTFTQEDKHKMYKAGFTNTNTIDEFQGGRSKHVILARLSKTMDVNLRTSSEQFIVAVSRHTERLDYCTVEQPSTLQDLVYKGINRTKAIQNLNTAYGEYTGDMTTRATLESKINFMGLVGGGVAPGLTNRAPVQSINACLDELIPGSTVCNLEFDNSMVEHNDLKVACSGDLRIPLCKIPAVLKPRKTLKPRIRTTMPPPRATTFRQSLFSLMKRNLGGTRIASPMDYRSFAKESLYEMLDVFGIENWRSVAASWEKIVPNQQDLEAWEKIQNTSTIAALSRIDPHVAATSLIAEMDDYQFILKAMPKAATDNKPLKVYPTVQTVMYHSKLVNSFFGPIIRKADVRFRSLLRSNVLYNKGKNIDDIEAFLDENYIRDNAAVTVENDFSDYDRSQQEVAHCLDEALLTLLGLSADDVSLWMAGHNVNTNYNFQLGLRVNLLYQRKSGDVTTAFGNTVLNMVALCHGLKLKRDEFQVAMFLGDDSWLQLKRTPGTYSKLRGCSERIAIHFNGEAKIATFKTGYFCGNYILSAHDRVLLMADPVKRAVKLGRWDVKNKNLLQENWISFRDLLRNYDNEDAQELLAQAVCERMPKANYGCLKLLIESLNSLHKSYKEFVNCYDEEVSVTIY